MSTYTQILYHIIFSTKNREPVLDEAHRDDFYRFTWGVLEKRQCHSYRIGGIEDHVHIFTSVHPSIALSDLVKEIKTSASAWIKGRSVFPRFTHWQEGYGAFTLGWAGKDALIEYIRHQKNHHRKETFREEYERLLEEAGLSINPEYDP